MTAELETTERELAPLDLRSRIQILEQGLAALPGAFFGDSDNCPLKHSFGNGIYMREIFIPKDTILTGKIHRHSHPNVLMAGRVAVVTEGAGLQILEGPMAMISDAGTKRALVALTDLHWITFHNVGEERDLEKIEAIVIAETYEQFEAEQLEAAQRKDISWPG